MTNYDQSEKNLSQEGNAWVCGNAEVSGNARVSGDVEHGDEQDNFCSYGERKDDNEDL